MTVSVDDRRSQAGWWAVLLTVLWLLAVPALSLYGFALNVSFKGSPTPQAARGAAFLLVAGVLAVLLPFIATVVGFRAGRAVLGAVYLVLTVLLLVPGGLLAATGADLLDRADPVPPPSPVWPGGCQEHSGGDTRCPGG